MKKDLLYKAAIVQTIAKQWPQLRDIESQCPLPDDNDRCSSIIEKAQRIAAGVKECKAIDNLASTPLQPIFTTVGASSCDYAYTSQQLVLQKSYFATVELLYTIKFC